MIALFIRWVWPIIASVAVPPSSDPSDFDIAAEMLSVGIRPCEVQSFLLFAANSPLFSCR
jgi:hypothetical protein